MCYARYILLRYSKHNVDPIILEFQTARFDFFLFFQFYLYLRSLHLKMKHVRQLPVATERATAHQIVQN